MVKQIVLYTDNGIFMQSLQSLYNSFNNMEKCLRYKVCTNTV